MSKRDIEKRVAELAALRQAPEETAVRELRRALGERSASIVAKAAALARERGLHELAPDLVAAFERFLANPVKSDPQCLAKVAIARALAGLEHPDPAVFLRGLAHFQPEPVWGGRQDSAATLRGVCALALNVTRLDSFEILLHLTGLLMDQETPARIDAARAIAQLRAREGVLPLRLKALAGDREPEVVGHCLAGLLNLAPRESVAFVAGFLNSEDTDLRMEAAGALSESAEPEAFERVREFWGRQTDPQVKCTILRFLAGSPLPAAGDFLLEILEGRSGEVAHAALEALNASRHRARLQDRIDAASGRAAHGS